MGMGDFYLHELELGIPAGGHTQEHCGLEHFYSQMVSGFVASVA